MLCPLGYSDKFVRIIDNQLLVQSRDEALGVAFQEGPSVEFFQAAKFSLWWLPEVNNMCRLRARETAGQGMEGGINVSFTFEAGQEEDDSIESACELSADQDMKRCNLIVSASPFSQGAYRFEGAFWPGRYMAYRSPEQLRMAGKVDEGNDVADFVLVDFSAAYKFMTTSEVLKGAVDSQGGAEGGYVKLSDLRADLQVRLYFQQMLGSAVWNNKDFETFFEGHYEEWDFDAKNLSSKFVFRAPLFSWRGRPGGGYSILEIFVIVGMFPHQHFGSFLDAGPVNQSLGKVGAAVKPMDFQALLVMNDPLAQPGSVILSPFLHEAPVEPGRVSLEIARANTTGRSADAPGSSQGVKGGDQWRFAIPHGRRRRRREHCGDRLP
eukprot:s2288_g4.t1